MIKPISEGTFGRVFKVININNKKEFALKIISFIGNNALNEQEGINVYKKMINSNNDKNIIRKEYCVNIYDEFIFNKATNKYYGIVFELLDKSLYNYIVDNNYHISHFYCYIIN